MAKVGDKFVVTVGKIIIDPDGKQYYFMDGFNTLVFDKNGLSKLEKCTPDNDAYKRGAEDAKKDIARRLKENDLMLMSKDAYKKDLDAAKAMVRDECENTLNGFVRAANNDYAKIKDKIKEYDELKKKYDELKKKYDEMVTKDIKVAKKPDVNINNPYTSAGTRAAFNNIEDLIKEFFDL